MKFTIPEQYNEKTLRDISKSQTPKKTYINLICQKI